MCVHGNAGKGTATLTVAANFDLGKLIRGSAYGAILIGKPEAEAEAMDPWLKPKTYARLCIWRHTIRSCVSVCVCVCIHI